MNRIAPLLILFGVILAILIAEPRNRRRTAAFFAGWILPGLGHLLLGRWVKGLCFLGLLGGLLLAGLWLCGWRTIAIQDNGFYYVGQFGSGLTLALGQLLGEPKAYPAEQFPPSFFDPGLLYVCVAGLLNIVVMLSVFEVKGSPAPSNPAAPGSSVTAGEAAP